MLTNATVKGARPGDRPYKMADSEGLYLLVRPNGSRVFRMKYRYECREKLLTFGTWPEIDLGEARERRDRAREQLRRGLDPSGRSGTVPDLEAVTFEILARRWHERRRARWSDVHAGDVLDSLERDVFPAIGALALAAIDAPKVLELLLAVEARGRVETARRLRERISAVFRLGISLKLASTDPAALIVDELSPRPLQRPQPALLELDHARDLLAAAELVDGAPIAKLASRFLALTAVRLGALRGTRWSELEGLDGDVPIWRIPAERMKLTKVKKTDPSAEHVVTLSRQAVEILRLVRALLGDVGADDLVFPGQRRGRPIGEGAIGDLYDRAGFAGRHVPHGWRATFSTILNERFPEDQALIDRALAHAGKKGKVEAAYNRSQHLERTRDLFQRWADILAPELLALPAPTGV
jgi:integrase